MPGAKLASIVATVKQISCLAIRYMTRCKLSIVQNHHLLVCISGRGASIKRKLITGSTPRARPRKKKKRKQESKKVNEGVMIMRSTSVPFWHFSHSPVGVLFASPIGHRLDNSAGRLRSAKKWQPLRLTLVYVYTRERRKRTVYHGYRIQLLNNNSGFWDRNHQVVFQCI